MPSLTRLDSSENEVLLSTPAVAEPSATEPQRRAAAVYRVYRLGFTQGRASRAPKVFLLQALDVLHVSRQRRHDPESTALRSQNPAELLLQLCAQGAVKRCYAVCKGRVTQHSANC